MTCGLKENAVDCLFAAGLNFNGFSATFKRGGETRRVRGFFVDGGTVATVAPSLNYVSAETRLFVVKRDDLDAMFPPRPRDEIEIEEPHFFGVLKRQIYEVFADENAPPFRYWNHARRYLAINLIEREDERK